MVPCFRRWLGAIAFGIALAPSLALAQNSIALKTGGIYTLSFEKVGFLGGLEIGRQVDEMVNINIGASIEKTGERKVTRSDSVSAQGGGYEYKKITVEDAHLVYPVKAGLRIRLPIGSSILPTLSGGLGYAFYNYTPNAHDSTGQSESLQTEGWHQGFYWESGIGFDWKLGSRSSLIADVVYQSAEPTNENDYARNLQGIQFYLGLLLEY